LSATVHRTSETVTPQLTAVASPALLVLYESQTNRATLCLTASVL